MKRRGPLVIGYDGSPFSETALQAAAELLAPCPALVVTVWEAGLAVDLFNVPSPIPAPIDIRTILAVDEKVYEHARQLAEHGAQLARKEGLEAEPLAVADEVTVAATLVRLARERNARAVAVGTRGHHGVTEVLLGTTSEEVIRDAPCPVVVRGPGKEVT
jgi:nucleotide-binding universal stress UspA family protein